MSKITSIGRSTQRVICMVLATVIVAASLSLGAIGAHSVQNTGYSVTITQLQ